MADEKRDVVMTVKLYPEESERIQEKADEAGLNKSEWVRVMLMAGAGSQVLEKQLRAARKAAERLKR